MENIKFTKEQKEAIIKYLKASNNVSEFEKENEDLCDMQNVFSCIDTLKSLFSAEEVNYIIINREELYKKLVA
jgi:hypothetical protein